MEIICKNKKLIIILLMSFTIAFCIVKFIPIVKENMREKQEIPLTQNFIDTFHENFEYGMTGEEIKAKLGEPSEIWKARKIKKYFKERYDYEGYEDRRGNWYEFNEEIKAQKGYDNSIIAPFTECYIYKIDIEGFSYAFFFIRDDHFEGFNLA